jgi:hypothetical protein
MMIMESELYSDQIDLKSVSFVSIFMDDRLLLLVVIFMSFSRSVSFSY